MSLDYTHYSLTWQYYNSYLYCQSNFGSEYVKTNFAMIHAFITVLGKDNFENILVDKEGYYNQPSYINTVVIIV
jgi:hypothetical protein